MVGGDGAGDAHQIGCSILDDLLCCLWLGDAAGTDDVTVDSCRDSLGKRPVICFAREPGGAASTDARRQVENGDARVVKCACGFDTLRNGETPFVELQGGRVVCDAEPDHEWQVFMHSCPDFFDDLEQQASPPCRCLAICVGTVVGQRAEKLPQQVAMRAVDLDEIVAGPADAASCCSKGANGCDDIAVRHLLRDQVRNRVLYGAWAETSSGHLRPPVRPGMAYLSSAQGAGGVDRCRDGGMSGYVCVRCQRDLAG